MTAMFVLWLHVSQTHPHIPWEKYKNAISGAETPQKRILDFFPFSDGGNNQGVTVILLLGKLPETVCSHLQNQNNIFYG